MLCHFCRREVSDIRLGDSRVEQKLRQVQGSAEEHVLHLYHTRFQRSMTNKRVEVKPGCRAEERHFTFTADSIDTLQFQILN